MASTITPRLMTVEEFRQLPETGPFYWELRGGELVKVVRPKFKHFRLQKRLERLLARAAAGKGVVSIEFAFRALPEYELRIADVAYVPLERWARTDEDDNLRGAPDLVIEVLSPSNTTAEIRAKERLCLENGCLEFWLVDPDRQLVRVSRPGQPAITYEHDQEMPLPLFGGTLSLQHVFNPDPYVL